MATLISSFLLLQGNVVVWKASDTSLLSSYLCYKIMREAGVPGGVLNFVPADGPVFGDIITKSPLLAGINFTGSSKSVQMRDQTNKQLCSGWFLKSIAHFFFFFFCAPLLCMFRFVHSRTFHHLWQEVAKNILNYKSYPRLIGGKFIVVLACPTPRGSWYTLRLQRLSGGLCCRLMIATGAIQSLRFHVLSRLESLSMF